MRRMILLLAGVVATILLSAGTSLAQSNDTDWSTPLRQDALAQSCEQASDQTLEAADQLLEEQAVLDDLEQESNDLTAQLDEEEALLEQLIDEQSALDYEVQDQDAFVYELEEEWAALDYEIQEQAAYVDQLAQESSAECPQAPQPVVEQPVAEQPVAEQAPVGPSDTASNQQVSTGSPNAAASSESEDPALTAFLQAQLQALQSKLAQTLQSKLAQTQTSQVCEVFSYGYSLPNPLTGSCESRPSIDSVGGPQLDPATTTSTPVGNATNPGPTNSLFETLAKVTGTAAGIYDRAKDGVSETGGPAPEEAEPSGQFDPTGTKDNYTGE